MTQVAVVVPHYRQQEQLDRALGALARQTLPPAEVVVADDGSPEPPRVDVPGLEVGLVRQADEGFRASAARALGASATSAPVLCFLDADTVPEPDYLERLTAVVGDGPRGTLAVGRRRHAELGGWTSDRLAAWWAGRGPGPVELAEPAWLRDAYAASRDLRDADDRSYRFVISAVMALPRELYDAAGGFDPSFVGYGGEDWDLAHRCWLAGGDLRHVPEAVAWHDGPDFAGRSAEEVRRVKDHETLQLAHVLTDPLARGAGLVWRHPGTVVELTGPVEAGALAACASSVLRDADAALWCVDLAALPEALRHDPRLHTGPVPADAARRARHRVVLGGPVILDDGLPGVLADGPGDYEDGGRSLLTLLRTRDLHRGVSEVPTRAARPAGIRPVEGEATLEARWGGWA